MTIRVFVAEHCRPCRELKEKLLNSELGDEVELIDIETEEGYEYVEAHGLTRVPSVYKDGVACEIIDKGDSIELSCPG